MIHYHGTPITPREVLYTLSGRFFCVSHADHRDVKVAHDIGQGVMLDNGAFSSWTKGKAVNWSEYYRWVEPWLDFYTTWAVIPDVIDGGTEENDALVSAWPHGNSGAPVWHMHEPIDRLVRLTGDWPRVCIGSSAQFKIVGSELWRRRMDEAMNRLCGNGKPPCWIHMLRGMQMCGDIYPFSSVDSADIARHHNGKRDPVKMAVRWDSSQCPARWTVREEQQGFI